MSEKYDTVTTSREPDWHDARATGIGASEMATVLGLSARKTPLELYAEKVGAVAREDLSEREEIEMGLLLEPVIITRYRSKSGRWADRDGRFLRSREHPWAVCTLDGITVDDAAPPSAGPAPVAPWPLELKTHSAFRAEDWVDGPPEPYLVQVQHQMLVTGAALATMACLIGGVRFLWTDVPRDEQMIRRIVYHGERFWERVLTRDPPPADGPGASHALRRIYPLDDGSTIELPAKFRGVLDELEEAKAAQKAAEQLRKALEAKIQEAMGEASRGIIPGIATVTWKAQTRAGYTTEPTTQRVLRISRPKRVA